MSDRHMHITSFLYGTSPEELAAFEAEARKHFVFTQRIIRPAPMLHLYGSDPCPVCGRLLGWEEAGEEREPEIRHPEPQCGWLPDGYPSTRRGQDTGRAPFDVSGDVIAFALYSKDGGGADDLMYTLPRAAEALSGILDRDIEIVSAWESAGEQAERVWTVHGRGTFS